MAESQILVLKFGGSVLRDETSIARAVHEIYRHVRRGYRVVAVVSALHGTTDALAAQARGYDHEPLPSAYAALLATGEQTSAALLALAVHRAGLPCEVADAARIRLRTHSSLLDAEPESVDASALRSLLECVPVVVVPGFVGLDHSGRTTLLGRGGSDFTALFLARALSARCRLVKDVRGLYERDPQRPGPLARPFLTIRYDDALSLDGRIVQHKAVRYAEVHDLEFEVATENRDEVTLVGTRTSRLGAPDAQPLPPLRVVLLGLGSIGLGVYKSLEALPQWFTVTKVAVRNVRRAADTGVPLSLLVPDVNEALAAPCDLVVELLGGLEPARSCIHEALSRGIPVVTANKAVLARHGEELFATAIRAGAELRFAAAVGGAVPVLETIARARAHGPIVAIAAVLNATSSFVLDRRAEGLSEDEAARAAYALGLAEADPTLDLDGSDAADKLCLCAHAAFGRWFDRSAVEVRGVAAAAPHDLLAAGLGRGRIRLVARLSVQPSGDGDRVALRTNPKLLTESHELGFLQPDQCGAVVRCQDGAEFRCSGRGAGRWPTAEAVLADLLDLRREREKHPAPASLQEVAS